MQYSGSELLLAPGYGSMHMQNFPMFVLDY
jgi:hypothetical protein